MVYDEEYSIHVGGEGFTVDGDECSNHNPISTAVIETRVLESPGTVNLTDGCPGGRSSMTLVSTSAIPLASY